MKVIDTDAHYLESIEELASYVPDDEPWKRRLEDSPDKIIPSNTPDHYLYGRIQRSEVGYLEGKMTPEEIPHAMEHVGVDETILLSQKAIGFSRIDADDRRVVVLANAYVDYMLDEVVDPDNGIYTMIPAPVQDPEAAAELIDRVGDEPGIVGVCLITAGAEPPLGNRRYDVIYEATQDAGLPIVYHAGGSSLDDFYISGYDRFIESHSLGFLWSNMAQLTSIVLQGVPEKFPDLDIVFQESGILWVSSFMGRLDSEYLKRQSEAPLLEKPPSEYMRDFYYGIQPLEKPDHLEYFENAIDFMGGPEQLLYASDYPHWDYDPPSVITDISFLSEREKELILSKNAQEVFGI